MAGWFHFPVGKGFIIHRHGPSWDNIGLVMLRIDFAQLNQNRVAHGLAVSDRLGVRLGTVLDRFAAPTAFSAR